MMFNSFRSWEMDLKVQMGKGGVKVLLAKEED
jgi:hypothetical protein